MKHYEIVFLVHPDQSEQVPLMLERYEKIVLNHHGLVHRREDWGRRQLAYSIDKVYKAHYALLNVECDLEALNEITDSFKFNDAILRHLVLSRKEAIKGTSWLAKVQEENHKGVEGSSSSERGAHGVESKATAEVSL